MKVLKSGIIHAFGELLSRLQILLNCTDLVPAVACEDAALLTNEFPCF